MYCPLIKYCEDSQYDLICDVNEDGIYVDQPLIEYTITTDELDPVSEVPIYDVHLWSLEPDVIGTHSCKI